jgi:hypothetical protein
MKAILGTVALGALVLGMTVTSAPPAARAAVLCPGGYYLMQVGGSGEAGCATLRVVGGAGRLTLKVGHEPAGAKQPAHIHRGKCGSNGPVVFPLNPVVNGMSVTPIAMSKWTMYNHGGFYINIHESADNIPHVVSCANITAMAMSGHM